MGLAIGAVACSNPTRHGGSGGNGGAGGGGTGGGGGSGGNAPPMTVDVVDPSLPPGVVGGFDGAGPGTSGITLVYPNAGALVPHDLAPIDVQWNGSSPVYRVTFAVDNGNRLRGYVKSADWIPPASNWAWLQDVAAGHQIQLSVDGATIDGNGTPQGAVAGSGAQALAVSRDDATGALFYFATTGDQITGDGTLERLELGAQMADKYLNKSNDGNGQCVGCHSLSRDGTRVAFTFLNLLGAGTGTTMSLGSVDATNPTMQQATAGTTAATSSFSPDGKQLVTAYDGKLSIRDAVTGALVMDLPTTGTAMFPDWSPDGSTIVFVRTAVACMPGQPNFGQSSIYAYGGSIVTITNLGRHVGQRAGAAAGGQRREQLLPVVLARRKMDRVHASASTSTKSSWSVANIGVHRPGRQRAVVRQPVGDDVDHAGGGRRSDGADGGERRGDEDQLVAQVGPQGRRRLPVALVLVDARVRQRADRGERASSDLDHRDPARRRDGRSVDAGGLVPVPGHDDEEPQRRLVAKGRRLYDPVTTAAFHRRKALVKPGKVP